MNSTEHFGTVILTFAVYLVGMLGIGVYAYLRTKNSSDYFLGGRSLGPWPAALSAGASDMSGWLLLGLPGYAYLAGLESLWLAGGLLLGTWLNWRVVARRLRHYSIVAEDALTLPNFFARRFEDEGGVLQGIAAVFVLLFFLFYTSSGLVAGGKLFEAVFGLNYTVALVAGTACVVSYTLFGGFLAVSWTDFVQGLLMAAALIIVPLVAIDYDGGISSLTHRLKDINPELLNPFTNTDGNTIGAIAAISLAAWGLGYFGQPHILARFKAVRSDNEVATARRIAVSWSFISMTGAVLVGLAGLVYTSGQASIVVEDSEKIFMILVGALFHPVVAGILLAAILAAIMSTADSQLLVSSSAFTEDLYLKWLRPNATDQECVMMGRIAVVMLSVIALLLAWQPENTVLGLVSYAWAGFGAAFGPTLLLALFWRRMNKWGALAGVVVGGLTVLIWKQLSGGLFDLYELVPGFVFATLAIIAVSLLSGAPSASITTRFDQVEKELA
ncbi:MAG: sodium/proline symporter PutP [Gammaproteobacteria bacterium]|nr:MAG: sodium/proline symporter PutP [Gammaproteobacteria bacterium]